MHQCLSSLVHWCVYLHLNEFVSRSLFPLFMSFFLSVYFSYCRSRQILDEFRFRLYMLVVCLINNFHTISDFFFSNDEWRLGWISSSIWLKFRTHPDGEDKYSSCTRLVMRNEKCKLQFVLSICHILMKNDANVLTDSVYFVSVDCCYC